MSTDASKLLRNALENEADVDVKVSYRLLSQSLPAGLGFWATSIRSQSTLNAVTIDKGTSKKSYKPEYIAFSRGLPMLVVEDKTPGADLSNAMRECQLYAHELNKSFPSQTNPCEWCMVTDGIDLILSRWDSCDPSVETKVSDLVVGSTDLNALQEFVGYAALKKRADEVRCRDSVKRRQARMLATGANNEEVPHNSFGAKIVADYRAVFEPENMKDREFVAKHAYIRSRHREQSADEIDRIVASAFSVSVPEAQPIRDTGRADEIMRVLTKGRKLENQILMLVGKRGAGKTTFVDYLRVSKLPQDIRDRTLWIHLNLNDAPKGRTELQSWVIKELVSRLEASSPNTDFNSPKVTRSLFKKEMHEFESRVLFNLERDSAEYRSRITDFLATKHEDQLSRAQALKHFLAVQKGKLLIVVFDNCDKRDRDDQLDCFEAARYVQKELECLIVLPIRDITYHLYRHEPPLDATSNALVFTIAAPRLSKIMARRIELILDQLMAGSKDTVLEHTLAGGVTVQYPKNDLGFYLTALYQSLYTHDKLIRSIVVGLSGNDIRGAIKIFLEFMRSGFISEHHYLAMKTTEGKYGLPAELVKQVLIRAGRQYFDEQGSFLSNLFQAREGAGQIGNLLRAVILLSLDELRQDHRRSSGATFVVITELISAVCATGFDEQSVVDEIDTLLERGLVIADHQKKSIESRHDRLRISPSGVVHIKLLGDIVYVGACSEDAFLPDGGEVHRIAHRLKRGNNMNHCYIPTLAVNGADLWSAIEEPMNSFVEYCSTMQEGVVADVVRRLKQSTGNWKHERYRIETSEMDWEDLENFYARDVFARAFVTSVTPKGVNVRLPGRYRAWIPKNMIASKVFSGISNGSLIECRILKWDDDRKSFLVACEESDVPST